MKKTLVLFLTISMILLLTVGAQATEFSKDDDYNIHETEVIRSDIEKEELKNIYADLFPKEYHYIEEYEANGVDENIKQNKVIEIFNETKGVGNKDYTLIVFNNGQIFTNISQITDSISPRVPDTYQKTQSFQVGDLGKYNTFKVTYVVYLRGYDYIVSYSDSGNGFDLLPTNKYYKKYENSSGNAYIAYNNVRMHGTDAPLTLYDIGVMVGNDHAKGFTRVSKGFDSFLWYILHTIIS